FITLSAATAVLSPGVAASLDDIKSALALAQGQGVTDPVPFTALSAELDLLGRLQSTATRSLAINQLTLIRTPLPATPPVRGTLACRVQRLPAINAATTEKTFANTTSNDDPFVNGALFDIAHLLEAEQQLGTRGCLYSDRCDFSLPIFVRETTARVTQVLEPTD